MESVGPALRASCSVSRDAVPASPPSAKCCAAALWSAAAAGPRRWARRRWWEDNDFEGPRRPPRSLDKPGERVTPRWPVVGIKQETKKKGNISCKAKTMEQKNNTTIQLQCTRELQDNNTNKDKDQDHQKVKDGSNIGKQKTVETAKMD